jgi:hypothetical protein
LEFSEIYGLNQNLKMNPTTGSGGKSMKEITINGEVYVPKDELSAVNTDGLNYCIIRTYSAGVHAGFLEKKDGKEVELINARRLWYWSGAFTLSELAKFGVKYPDKCKFSTEVEKILLTEAIEIIPCTQKSEEIIRGVKNYECK